MMKKIKLYVISRCREGSSEEDFNKNICSIVSSKKQIQEYILNKVINDHRTHYSLWLSNHGLKDNDQSKNIYVNLRLAGGDPSVEEFCVREQIYNTSGIAAMFRIFNKCEPIGCSYETRSEKEYYAWFVQEITKTMNEAYANELTKKAVDSEEK